MRPINPRYKSDAILEENQDWTGYLIDAAHHGRLEEVKYLLSCGEEVSCVNSMGEEEGALFSAWKQGHTEVVKLLLEQGAGKKAPNFRKEKQIIDDCLDYLKKLKGQSHFNKKNPPLPKSLLAAFNQEGRWIGTSLPWSGKRLDSFLRETLNVDITRLYSLELDPTEYIEEYIEESLGNKPALKAMTPRNPSLSPNPILSPTSPAYAKVKLRLKTNLVIETEDDYSDEFPFSWVDGDVVIKTEGDISLPHLKGYGGKHFMIMGARSFYAPKIQEIQTDFVVGKVGKLVMSELRKVHSPTRIHGVKTLSLPNLREIRDLEIRNTERFSAPKLKKLTSIFSPKCDPQDLKKIFSSLDIKNLESLAKKYPNPPKGIDKEEIQIGRLLKEVLDKQRVNEWKNRLEPLALS